jgi:hypothetical protein
MYIFSSCKKGTLSQKIKVPQDWFKNRTLLNGVVVQPTAQLVGLFCSWCKSKKPRLPHLITTIHVENDSGRFGNKKTISTVNLFMFPISTCISYNQSYDRRFDFSKFLLAELSRIREIKILYFILCTLKNALAYYNVVVVFFFGSATPCAFPPPRPSIFFRLFFSVHRPVNRTDRHLLAYAMAPDVIVTWQFSQREFFSDKTPRSIFPLFNTQTIYIKSIIHNSIAMSSLKKTLHPGEIRPRIFCYVGRCDGQCATPPGPKDFFFFLRGHWLCYPQYHYAY